MKTTVSDLIVKYMERLGIEFVFGMPSALDRRSCTSGAHRGTSHPVGCSMPVTMMYWVLKKTVSAVEFSEARLRDWVRLIETWRPTLLYGYASAMTELARFVIGLADDSSERQSRVS